MLELDSRFGVERVQSVSLLSGQGHRLAASEETDPLTVDHCCGRPGCRTIYPVYIQPGRWVSAGGRRRNTLQEDAARIYGALSVAGVKLFQQSFGFSFMRGMSCFHHFQTHFSRGDLGVICFLGQLHKQTPQIFIIFLPNLEIIKQGGTDFSVVWVIFLKGIFRVSLIHVLTYLDTE